jgi:hypothetical protein
MEVLMINHVKSSVVALVAAVCVSSGQAVATVGTGDLCGRECIEVLKFIPAGMGKCELRLIKHPTGVEEIAIVGNYHNVKNSYKTGEEYCAALCSATRPTECPKESDAGTPVYIDPGPRLPVNVIGGSSGN